MITDNRRYLTRLKESDLFARGFEKPLKRADLVRPFSLGRSGVVPGTKSSLWQKGLFYYRGILFIAVPPRWGVCI